MSIEAIEPFVVVLHVNWSVEGHAVSARPGRDLIAVIRQPTVLLDPGKDPSVMTPS